MPWAGSASLTETTIILPPPPGAVPAGLPAALARGRRGVPVSATLAANEALASRRSRGEPVLP
ncbi:MAG: hypothetical protein WBH47_07220, partial [Streptosporangiaceae bacterium]